MKNYALIFVFTVGVLAALPVSFAQACDGCDRLKPKGYDRPYGNSLDSDYQDDFHAKRRAGKDSLFSQDLYDDSDVFYKKREGYDDTRSYMVPERKKTIPTWGKSR